MAKRSARAKRTGGAGWSLTPDENGPKPEPAPGGDARRGREGRPVARLRIEKRRGKPVTVCALEGLPAGDTRALGRDLRQVCGTGGTARGPELELQGDQRDRLRDVLRERGFTVRG